ncbi:dTMP kinase [Candidatus Saganbacteria bacterium]|nr:dTMP kinase [Candidatus Saganbacteria bacterium]
MFISFEGGEGCGKTTQIELLSKYLASKGQDVVITKEPGGTSLGMELRKILLEKEPEILSEIFLFAADRVEHVEKIIKPALDKKKTIICDRYMDSTLAYQLGGRGLPEDLVRYVNWVASRGLVPDITILLDVPVEVGLKRAKERGNIDRFEKEIVAFHERVRDKYLEIAQNDKKRVKVINSTMPVEDVQNRIREEIEKYFSTSG